MKALPTNHSPKVSVYRHVYGVNLAGYIARPANGQKVHPKRLRVFSKNAWRRWPTSVIAAIKQML
tara:strand:- start:69447 stop:69641 length:195 start_codon:yes stop_codon:yes gene_type:complete